MINPFAEVQWNPDLRARKKFALSLIIGFPAIAVFFSLALWVAKHSWKPYFLWLGISGLVVGTLLFLVPQIARPFYVAWYFVACCIGIVTGNVLFSLFFYLVFTPFGFFRRVACRDAFSKGFDKGRASYWEASEKVTDAKRYYRQF